VEADAALARRAVRFDRHSCQAMPSVSFTVADAPRNPAHLLCDSSEFFAGAAPLTMKLAPEASGTQRQASGCLSGRAPTPSVPAAGTPRPESFACVGRFHSQFPLHMLRRIS